MKQQPQLKAWPRDTEAYVTIYRLGGQRFEIPTVGIDDQPYLVVNLSLR